MWQYLHDNFMLLRTQRKIKLARWHNGTINSINRSRVASKTFLLLHHLDIIGNIVTSAFHHPLGKTSQKKNIYMSLLACLEKVCLLSVNMFEALRFIYLDWPLRENNKKCLRTKYFSTYWKSGMRNFVYSTYFGKQQRSKHVSATKPLSSFNLTLLLRPQTPLNRLRFGGNSLGGRAGKTDYRCGWPHL